MKRNFLFLALVVLPMIGYAQPDCKVYPSEIAEFYVGECKKGLANGQGKAEGIDTYEGEFKKGYPNGYGIYTWKNGNVYKGEFHRGLKDGKGELTFTYNGRDSTTVGYWSKDEYIGLTNEGPYKVIQNTYITKYDFNRGESDMNEVNIVFLQNGSQNMGISNLVVQTSSGSYDLLNNGRIKIRYFDMPLEVQLRYTTMNSMKSKSTNCIFVFKINADGRWVVNVTNQ